MNKCSLKLNIPFTSLFSSLGSCLCISSHFHYTTFDNSCQHFLQTFFLSFSLLFFLFFLSYSLLLLLFLFVVVLFLLLSFFCFFLFFVFFFLFFFLSFSYSSLPLVSSSLLLVTPVSARQFGGSFLSLQFTLMYCLFTSPNLSNICSFGATVLA